MARSSLQPTPRSAASRRSLRRSRLLAVAPLCLAVVAAALAQGDPNRVRVTTVSAPDGVRVVLELDRPAAYEVRVATRRVYVELFDDRFTVELPEGESEGVVLERVGYRQVEGGVQLFLDAGPAFVDHEQFTLSHPFRIVVQMNGTYPAPETRPRPGADPASFPSSVPSPEDSVPSRATATGLRTVVIDPGHGGEESGAQGPSGVYEKDLVLDLATRLAGRLDSRLGVEAVLTRRVDRTLSLDERAAIANHARGQLFISIHANAARVATATGAETYFLSYEATDDEARLIAARENGTLGVDPELAPPGSGIEFLLWDLAQSQYLEQSSRLAEAIQDELNRALGLRNRGIKQAPFKVLMGVAMPAVLVEVGFLSNPDEERRLTRDRYKEQVVEALYRAVRDFKLETDRRLGADGGARSGR